MKNVLLIEDDLTLAQGIKYSLELEDYIISLGNSIEEANNLYNNGEFSLIILDVMLPDGLGYDFCKKVRLSSDIPIIFLTACDEEVNIVQGLDIGGDDYITKPFRIRELLSRINVALRRYKGYQNNNNSKILETGNLKINIIECKVLKDNSEVILTSVEYKLLLLFINNPKKLMSRDSILENIWSIDSDFVDNNTLSVYIKRLREKIEDKNSDIKYIKTQRGLGYIWDVKVR